MIITHKDGISHKGYFQVLCKLLLSLLKVLKIRLLKMDTSCENITWSVNIAFKSPQLYSYYGLKGLMEEEYHAILT